MKLSLAQFVSSAITAEATTNTFNSTASDVVDAMAFHNLAFADVKTYVASVEQAVSSGELLTSLRNALTNRPPAVGSVEFARSYLRQLYATFTRGRLLLAEEVKILIPSEFEETADGAPISGSRFSRIPGSARLAYTTNALLGYGPDTWSPLHKDAVWSLDRPKSPAANASMTVASNVFKHFHDLAADPMFGNCAYGFLPFVYPSTEPMALQEGTKQCAWHGYQDDFLRSIDLEDAPTSADTDDEEVNARIRAREEAEAEEYYKRLTNMLHKLLIQLVIDYNIGEDYAAGIVQTAL
ncbi:hypothetical protein EVB87_197 [Rhizobium phage RHph_N28_1]|nr:hypothetical protein EVB87_197 [Rhizobium phage RHph_N28_1]QIG74226.1 hypothetical protein EVC07_198 [Rhizobium phage RHph_N42]QXV73886.1 hypothetical protein [Rhizobium phage RHph_N46]